jgi:crossover junction endodeoxyribonuclease RuvC
MTPQRFLGVDPGADGGWAVLGNGPEPVMAECFKSSSGIAWADWADLLATLQVTHAVVEKVHAMPGQGVTSMFSMGHNLGCIEGVLLAKRIPYRLVAPQSWKKIILRDGAHDKSGAIAYCRRAFPNVDLRRSATARLPHDGKADALCMAELCRRDHMAPS